MHNDRLQGILFDQPPMLDLTRRRRRLSLQRKINVSHYIPISRPRPSQFIGAKKRREQYEAALDDLQKRLKARDF